MMEKTTKSTLKKTTKSTLKKPTKSPLKKSTKPPLKKSTKSPLKKTTKSPLKKTTKSPLKKTTKPTLKNIKITSDDLKNDPHLLYLSRYGEIGKNIEYTRKYEDKGEKMEYRSDRSVGINDKIILEMMHHGQRKLLLSEIEFLTNYDNRWKKTDKNRIVVYVGAAPGFHTPYLVKLFPNITWHLYDKTQFAPKLKELSNVTLHQKYFDNQEAKKYINKNVFLISDIRNLEIRHAKESTSINKSDINKSDNIVYGDMQFQMDWFKIINPSAAMFKFRLPWTPGKTTYLDGDIYYQVWAGKHSTETRLIPNNKMKTYDNTNYEQRMFYFNRIPRRTYYNHDVGCYDHCYDCRSEIEILKRYLILMNKEPTLEAICQMGETISKLLGKKLFQQNLSNWNI
jgi:hypothetical protein